MQIKSFIFSSSVFHSHGWLKVDSKKNLNKSLINFNFKNSAYFNNAQLQSLFPKEILQKKQQKKCH